MNRHLLNPITTCGELATFLHGFQTAVNFWLEIPSGASAFIVKHHELYSQLVGELSPPGRKYSCLSEFNPPEETVIQGRAAEIIAEMQKDIIEIGLATR